MLMSVTRARGGVRELGDAAVAPTANLHSCP